ncbi:MAG: SpaH/EbpB family LPXTG-anchored major pilin [Clostridiales bacterium]|nr:SpaH/EbpB family LPXTG-anchored major pilin [Clostridiales bacterium]
MALTQQVHWINKVDSNNNAIENVGFSTIQVAEIVQVTQEISTGVYETSLMFLLTDAGKALFGDHDTYGSYLYGEGTAYSTDPITVYCYSSDELQDALDALIAASTASDYSDIATYLNTTLAASYDVYSGLTDSNGVLEVNSGNAIPIGVYLVVEDTTLNNASTVTKINGSEVEIDEIARPFLVTVPQTEYDSNNSQYVWQYDVTVTPKNVVYSSSKKIYDEDGNPTSSVSVGETFEYRISAEIIETNSDSAYTSYVLTDTAADGIEYLNMDNLTDFIKIYLDNDDSGAYNSGDTLFTYSTDYTVDIVDNGTSGISVTVTFTDAGLAILNAVTGTTDIYFEYYAYLSKEAGTTGLVNSAKIDYTCNNGSGGSDDPDDPKVYTYSIDLTKEFAEALTTPADASGVTFGIQDSDDNDIWAVDNSDGTYTYAAITEIELADLVANTTANSDIQATANTDGTYTVTYDCNTSDLYTVTYTKAFAIYVTEDQSTNPYTYTYTLSVGGLKEGTYTITELSTIDGFSLLKDDFDVTISATYVNGSLYSGGNTNLTVLNETEPIFMLPFTGGLGSLLYTAIGFGFIAFAIYLVVKVCGGKRAVQ